MYLNTITVEKTKLLAALRKNLEMHKRTVEEAQAGFRRTAIAELERTLADARRGMPIRLMFNLPVPSDHSKDYERAIAMLEMDVHEEVELDGGQYAAFIEDDWEWRAAFLVTNSRYTS